MEEHEEWEVVLKYTRANGTQREVGYHQDVEKISLRQKIVSIDLTPLSSCTNLRTLDLYGNQLQRVDLTPLGSCVNLEDLKLGNQFQYIDLTPLSSCTKLQELHLNAQLQSIDLTPLSSCTELRQLWLGDNQLQSIDLTPLSFCTNLQDFSLRNNQLRNIDLTPLSLCTELQAFSLGNNQLQTIDLSPLGSCTHLQNLSLSRNQLQTLDLTPLSPCKFLSELDFNENQLWQVFLPLFTSCDTIYYIRAEDNPLRYIDVTPLKSCPQLPYLELDRDVTPETIMHQGIFNNKGGVDPGANPLGYPPYSKTEYDAPIKLANLEVVAYTFQMVGDRDHWKVLHLLHEALSLLDFDWIGMIDLEITDAALFLKDILGTERESVREMVNEKLVQVFCLQVDKGGTTIGLDTERISFESAEFVQRIQDIAELRLEELTRVSILQRGEQIDLKLLWLTAYGHQILSSQKLGISCSINEFEQVKKAVAEIGSEIQIITNGHIQFPTEMSEGLREYIWHVADYNARHRLGHP